MREQVDSLQARLRQAETNHNSKETDAFHQMRELQAKDMEVKNQQIVEINRK